MTIRVVLHTEEFRIAARDFNRRMNDGGSNWGVYLEPESDWLSGQPGGKVWREHYVAVDEKGFVRGGFVLKPQEWLIRGETQTVTDWQGPVSEGNIDPHFATLAIRLMREMTKLYPAVFSWGHGGSDQPLVKMLEKMGWPAYETPFCLLVLKPYRFLRLNAYLRRTKAMRTISDIAAFSGVAYLLFSIFRFAKRLRSRKRFGAIARKFLKFEHWADELWQRCKGQYDVIAVRDSDSMNRLAPDSKWPPVVRLKVEKNQESIGWALVMHTQMCSDARFGDLYVGSIVDCFSDPMHAGEVVHACTQYLEEIGVDLVVSNQAHPAWVNGFSDNGYVILPKRRLFVTSPALRKLLEPFDEIAQGLHLTNMDGHGPHAL